MKVTVSTDENAFSETLGSDDCRAVATAIYRHVLTDWEASDGQKRRLIEVAAIFEKYGNGVQFSASARIARDACHNMFPGVPTWT